MKPILALFVLSLTVGCAGQGIKADIPSIETSAGLLVEDLRPAEEKESKIFSMLMTSEAYGTYRRGDDIVDPTPIRIFQHRAYEKLPPITKSDAIKVHHFVVYMNLKSELRRQAVGALSAGVIGAVIAAGTQKYGVDGIASITTPEEFASFDEEYKRALYSAEENPNKASVFVVFLEAEIGGKRAFVKTMTPTRLPEADARNSHVVAVEAAIAYFLDQIQLEG